MNLHYHIIAMTDSLIQTNVLTKAQDSPHASLSNTSNFCSKLITLLAYLATFSTFLTLHMLRGHRLTKWIITLMMSAIKIKHKRMNSRKDMLNLHTEEMWKCTWHSRLNISEQWMAVNNTFTGRGKRHLWTVYTSVFLLQLTIYGHKKVCTYMKPQIAKN